MLIILFEQDFFLRLFNLKIEDNEIGNPPHKIVYNALNLIEVIIEKPDNFPCIEGRPVNLQGGKFIKKIASLKKIIRRKKKKILKSKKK